MAVLKRILAFQLKPNCGYCPQTKAPGIRPSSVLVVVAIATLRPGTPASSLHRSEVDVILQPRQVFNSSTQAVRDQLLDVGARESKQLDANRVGRMK